MVERTQEQKDKYNEYQRNYRKKKKEEMLKYWRDRYNKTKDDEETILKRKEYYQKHKNKKIEEYLKPKTEDEIIDEVYKQIEKQKKYAEKMEKAKNEPEFSFVPKMPNN